MIQLCGVCLLTFQKLAYHHIMMSKQQPKLYSNEKNGLQQFKKEGCQPIKRLKDKKKMKKKKKKLA
jgi:hypothetical protein